MARILTNDDLYQMILDIIDDIVKEMGIKIASQYLLEFGTKNPTNKNYIRTGNVYKAWRSSPGAYSTGHNSIGWDLINADQIIPKTTEPWYMFNAHRNWNGEDEWNGLYVPDMVPEWLNSGFTIVNARGERFKFTGRKYVEQALGLPSLRNKAIQKHIEEETAKRIYKKLKQMGVV